jgi:hypothetical protein
LKSSFEKYFLFLDFDKNWRTFIDINLVKYNQEKILYDGLSINEMLSNQQLAKWSDNLSK